MKRILRHPSTALCFSTTLRSVAALAVMLLLWAPANLHAADFSTGGTFLDLGHGARAHALGGGGIALLRTDAAAYWNPANLAWLQTQHSATVMHATILPGVSDGYNTLSLGRGFGKRLGLPTQEWRPTRGAYGLFISHMGFEFDSGKSWSENVLKLALAVAPNNYTSLGVGVRLLQANNDFAAGGGKGVGIDLALSLHVTEHLRGALVARDLWTRIEWDTDTSDTPGRTFATGLEYSRWRTSVIVDVILNESSMERFVAGAEWSPFGPFLQVRGALTALLPGESRAYPSGGLGIQLSNFTFDYGASFDEDDGLDVGQRVSLRLGF